MMRGTFANIRIRNEMVPGVEGGLPRHVPGTDQQLDNPVFIPSHDFLFSAQLAASS